MNKNITRLGIVATLFTLAIAPPGCGGESNTSGNGAIAPGDSCLEGMQEACTCDDGARGAMVCEGGVFGACDCTVPPPSSGANCGNGTIDLGEQCDGNNVNGETCGSYTMMAMPTGTLTCTSSCMMETSGCQAPAGTGGAPGAAGAGGAPAGGTGGTMGGGGTLGGGGTGTGGLMGGP